MPLGLSLGLMRLGGLKAALNLNLTSGFLDPRITFSRGTTATLVDATGRITYAPANLVLQSGTYSNAAYSVTSGVTFSGQTATFTSTAFRYQPVAVGSSVLGRTFIVSVVLSSASKTNIVLRLAADPTGTDQATSLITLTPTPTRYSVVRTFTSADTTIIVGLDNRVSNGGSGIAGDVVVADWQLEPVTYQTTPSTYVATTASAYYGPRFDYDPVTLAPKGLLIEEARTNLLLYSQQFDNAAWTKGSVTISANSTVGPDGASTADTITPSAALTTHTVRQVSTSGATVCAQSIFYKPNGYTKVAIREDFVAGQYAAFNCTGAGSVIDKTAAATASITAFPNGWYRLTLVPTTALALQGMGVYVMADGYTTGDPSGYSYSGNGISGGFIYGAQLEAGSFATSYIPTVASTVTRSADVATMTGTNFSSWYNQSEGTWSAQFSGNGSYAVVANDGTTNNYNGITYNSPTSVRGVTVAGGVFAGVTMAGGTAGTVNKTAYGYKLNDLSGSTNGAAVVTNATAAIPTLTQLIIGSYGGFGQLNGHIRQIAYYNTRLPNAQLQSLTA